MKKISVLIVITLLFYSCKKDPQTSLKHLNGYWEIESATTPKGKIHEYSISTTVDYISINDSLKGFRKKLNPTFTGSYNTSEDAEMITAKIENDSLNLYYRTPFSTWKETVIVANKEQLKVVNADNMTYIYKRFTPINVLE
ncbi:hypothetical protein ES677_11280 [Bizionia gelidisalsuginis]|uniref:Lipocalin-like domain-containing protein n=2 Tax=Bizionia TaxID=283785 RepID=A0A8H2LBC7_9FLAO|nr:MULTISPECIES: hypothetical protein [Bizionia]TYB70497.1 hypothetical protein ES676_13275 [Bizionia saleffrena]TYC10645.1 hypothetical protein ES677_11280 [Bizionia gelidisalsuginis]